MFHGWTAAGAGLLLAAEDRAHFLTLMRRQTNSAVHRRISALLLDDGWTAERVDETLFIDADTVRAHKQRFLASGRAGIERLDYAGHAPVLAPEQSEALAAELVSRFYHTNWLIC